MENYSSYSVLMSVYAKEKAEYLKTAMNSMFDQTIPTDDFVLVCDGPLNDELDTVIAEMEKSHSELHVIRLEENVGLGRALNIGMKHCKNELVARMDSDDVSRPDRCQKQLMVFREQPQISICSGIIEEFTEFIDQVEARRVPPETHDEIMEFAKRRNPFNHVSVMFRKSAVEASGGYQDFYLLEDYYLWIRMLQKGCVCYNLQQPLVWVRVGAGMYKRRSGWQYVESQKALFTYMRNSGFISEWQYVKNVAIREVVSIVPDWLRKFVFLALLRKKN